MAQVKRDYYDVLGVERDADAEAIKQAFRARARELHPDISDDPEADEGFRELAEAYEVLSKPEARLLYDRFGYRGWGRGGFEGGADGVDEAVPPTELYDWIVNGRRPEGGADVFAEVEVDELRAREGTTKRVKLVHVEPCGTCRGAGIAPGARRNTCTSCGGKGWRKEASDFEGTTILQLAPCDSCGGAGTVATADCRACRGEGRVTTERRARVRIPPGTTNGERIRLAGEGVARTNGERGDAWILVRVQPLPEDSRLVRYGAIGGLAVAIGFLALLFLSPSI